MRRVLLLLCLFAPTLGARRHPAPNVLMQEQELQAVAEQQEVLEAEEFEQEDDEALQGFNYPRAPEYEAPWKEARNEVQALAEFQKKLEELEKGEFAGDEAALKKEALEFIMLLSLQKDQQKTRMSCQDTCAICLPPDESFDNGDDVALKSVFVGRGKSWRDSVKTGFVAPVDATIGAAAGGITGVLGGTVGGVAGGVLGGVVVGGMVSNATGGQVPGAILGTLAGLSTGAVSGAGILAMMSVAGLVGGGVSGVGLTGAVTKCKRVEFVAAFNGTHDAEDSFENTPWNSKYGMKKLRDAMGYDAKWFSEGNPDDGTLAVFDSGSESADYAAISHCEYIRDRNFDVRHLNECIKHSRLCGKNGALLIPTNEGTCQKLSDTSWMEAMSQNAGEEENLFSAWTAKNEAKREKQKCISTLCKYGGYKRGALKTHPDRLGDVAEEEKEARINDFRFMTSCGERFKGEDKEPLTLNKKEDRDKLCSS